MFTYWFCFLITVRGGVFHILGTLCELFPEHMTPYADKLVDMYLRTLKGEVRRGGGALEMFAETVFSRVEICLCI